MTTIRIATRKSPLALRQAEMVAERLRTLHRGLRVELVPMSTRGDKLLGAPLAAVGGKGLFLKELEQALIENRADIAVHSVKDVTVTMPDGLCMPVITSREDPGDALVSNRHESLETLPDGARIGTSSLRRRCQLNALRPGLEVIDLRGGVHTRLKKLDGGEFDALILACAGLLRLGLEQRIAERLNPDRFVPAIGQGAIGIELRRGDAAAEALISPLNDRDSSICVRAERAMNEALGGGCQVPIAGHAKLRDNTLSLIGVVSSIDGTELIRVSDSAPDSDPESLGRRVADTLISRGAKRILDAVYAGV
ncbi:MAG TPA: hydroxymethylbilane synthase [Gammaproteobacteria bacterium]|nr:hydroxymethylbilane synthase [Gammaproteobacteria bacterium]